MMRLKAFSNKTIEMEQMPVAITKYSHYCINTTVGSKSSATITIASSKTVGIAFDGVRSFFTNQSIRFLCS